MCIVALAWQLFENKPLALLSNRDEFFPANRLDKLLGSRYGTRVSSLLTITHTGFDMQEKNLENDTIIRITPDVNAS